MIQEISNNGGTEIYKTTSRLLILPRRIEENSRSSYLYDMHYRTKESLHKLYFIFYS